MSTATTSLVDFLIIAPLKEEREAVLAHLGNARRLPPDEQDVRVYYQADLATQLADGLAGSYRVIVTSPLGMGRVEAATATVDALSLIHICNPPLSPEFQHLGPASGPHTGKDPVGKHPPWRGETAEIDHVGHGASSREAQIRR